MHTCLPLIHRISTFVQHKEVYESDKLSTTQEVYPRRKIVDPKLTFLMTESCVQEANMCKEKYRQHDKNFNISD